MSSRRMAKISEAIREQVSLSVLFDIRDPRVRNVTVLGAEVSADLRHAKVFVSVMGDERTQSLCMHGLNSARGFLQSKVADRLQTRYTPLLTFVLDEGVKKSVEAARILKEVLPPETGAQAEAVGNQEEQGGERDPAGLESSAASQADGLSEPDDPELETEEMRESENRVR